MIALERLYDLELSSRVRYEAAAAVGSDVPFFLWPGAQLAMGRGQVLKAVQLPGLHLVIAMPDLGLSTAAVYRWRDEDAEVTLKEFASRARSLSGAAQAAATPRDVAKLVANDLEPSVVARKEKVRELIGRLHSAGALAAAMTGSGAACFGVFAGEAEALRAREAAAPARAWYVTDLQPEGRTKAAARRGRGKPPA
jgi:4-diphosphocytidyl-2-C-methyl-D-erythritol kinase